MGNRRAAGGGMAYAREQASHMAADPAPTEARPAILPRPKPSTS